MEPLRLLCIFAHPDDESMGMGATIAKYAQAEVETSLVCATRGERGWFGPEQENPGLEKLGQLRTRELMNAAGELGVKQIKFLGYIDGELDQADPAEAAGRIVSQIRRIKPQVVVTFPPDGNYGHPDHIAVSQLSSAAVVSAADASYHDPDDAPPHRVSKMYYMVDSEAFIKVVKSLLGEVTFDVDGQARDQVAWREWMITTRIDMFEYCPAAWRAIRCHKSQLASLGPLAEVPENEAASLLARQGTFYRVFSQVNGGRKIERDLFEGLR